MNAARANKRRNAIAKAFACRMCLPYVRTRTHGIRRQTFFSSPRLKMWFDTHAAVIDERVFLSERREYIRNCMESRKYRAELLKRRAV